MMRLFLASIFLLTHFAYEGDVAAQTVDEYLAASARLLEDWGAYVYKEIDSRGAPIAKLANRKVRFQVEHSFVPNASMTVQDNSQTPVLRMADSYHMVLVFIADVAVQVGRNPRYINCETSYQQHIHDVLADSSRRIQKGQSAILPQPPEDYFKAQGGMCAEFAKYFPIAEILRAERDYWVWTVATLTYLHELAHWSLHHEEIDSSRFDKARTEEEREAAFIQIRLRSRQQESEADAWAVKQAVILGFVPKQFLNTVMASYFLSFTGLDCGFQLFETHPNGLQRYSQILDTYRNQYQATNGSTLPKQFDDLIGDMKRFAAKVQSQLKCSRQ